MNQFVVTAGTRIVGTWASVLGAVFTAGGPERLMGPTFSVVAQVPGAPATWGLPLTVFGLLTLLGDLNHRPRIAQAGLYLVGFVRAVQNDPHAAVTGPFTYGLIVALSVLFATGQRRPAPARQPHSSSSKENQHAPAEGP
jgi:hypothetical protein